MTKKKRVFCLWVFSVLCILFITACGNKSETFGNVSKGFKLQTETNFIAGRFLSLLSESQRKTCEQKTLSYIDKLAKTKEYGDAMSRLGTFERTMKSVPFDKDGRQVSYFRGVTALPKCTFYEIQLTSDNLLPTKEEDIVVKERQPKTIEKLALQMEKGKEPPDVFYWYDSYDQNKPFYLENKLVWYILMDKFYLAVPYFGEAVKEDIPVRVFLMEPKVFSVFMNTLEKNNGKNSKGEDLSPLIHNSKLIRQLAEDYACLTLAASVYNNRALEIKYKEFLMNPYKALGQANNANVNENKNSQQTNQPSSTNTAKSNIGIINGDEVNVRKGPGVKYDSLGVFYKGDKVRLVGEQGNDIGETWYQIEYDNPTAGLIKGWVRKDFINLSKTGETAAANQSIKIKRVRSSSHLVMKELNKTYPASQIADGVINTCWSEGVPGYGVNEKLDFELGDVYELKGFNIWTGYQKSEELFYKNGRPVALMVRSEDGYSHLHKFNDSMGMQRITFTRPIKARYLSFTIMEVAPGKTAEDSCISELSLF